jgi:hypothetical protein
MTASCTASAAYVLAVVDVAVKAGAARARLLQQLGDTDFSTPLARVPIARLAEVHRAAEVCAIGRDIGRRIVGEMHRAQREFGVRYPAPEAVPAGECRLGQGDTIGQLSRLHQPGEFDLLAGQGKRGVAVAVVE